MTKLLLPGHRALPFSHGSNAWSYRIAKRCMGISTLKERVVILGVGWAGFRLAKDLDKARYDVTIVSPRNHFLFTPLLPSTSVGTLEFRCVQEPARTIKGVHYYQAWAKKVDLDKRTVSCRDVYQHYGVGDLTFDIPYDKLIIAVGTKSNTFNVPGFRSNEEMTSPTGTDRRNVFFLKQLEHSRALRNKIIECFEKASSPFVSPDERERLLNFVVVGGGPTSIEFAAELSDFLRADVSRWYKDLKNDYKVIIVEASNQLLGTFDKSLSSYVEKSFRKRNITVLMNETVKEVKDISVVLGSGRDVPFGVCVWSTGNAPLDFVKDLGLELTDQSRIMIDDHLRVKGRQEVFALGDCAAQDGKPLAMLAQVANQQAIHLARCLNTGELGPFHYKFMGAMAQLGTFKGIADLNGPKLKGILAFAVWRSAYWTMSVSITNKILIPMFWFKSFWFGRDISKF